MAKSASTTDSMSVRGLDSPNQNSIPQSKPPLQPGPSASGSPAQLQTPYINDGQATRIVTSNARVNSHENTPLVSYSDGDISRCSSELHLGHSQILPMTSRVDSIDDEIEYMVVDLNAPELNDANHNHPKVVGLARKVRSVITSHRSSGRARGMFIRRFVRVSEAPYGGKKDEGDFFGRKVDQFSRLKPQLAPTNAPPHLSICPNLQSTSPTHPEPTPPPQFPQLRYHMTNQKEPSFATAESLGGSLGTRTIESVAHSHTLMDNLASPWLFAMNTLKKIPQVVRQAGYHRKWKSSRRERSEIFGPSAGSIPEHVLTTPPPVAGPSRILPSFSFENVSHQNTAGRQSRPLSLDVTQLEETSQQGPADVHSGNQRYLMDNSPVVITGTDESGQNPPFQLMLSPADSDAHLPTLTTDAVTVMSYPPGCSETEDYSEPAQSMEGFADPPVIHDDRATIMLYKPHYEMGGISNSVLHLDNNRTSERPSGESPQFHHPPVENEVGGLLHVENPPPVHGLGSGGEPDREADSLGWYGVVPSKLNVVAQPLPAVQYQKISPNFSPISFSTNSTPEPPTLPKSNPIKRFFRNLNDLPWVSSGRVTVDYVPNRGGYSAKQRDRLSRRIGPRPASPFGRGSGGASNIAHNTLYTDTSMSRDSLESRASVSTRSWVYTHRASEHVPVNSVTVPPLPTGLYTINSNSLDEDEEEEYMNIDPEIPDDRNPYPNSIPRSQAIHQGVGRRNIGVRTSDTRSYSAINPFVMSIAQNVRPASPYIEDMTSPYAGSDISMLQEPLPGRLGTLPNASPSTSQYVVVFLLDTIPRQIYLHLQLRLPSLYFSRVTRIFEDAELSMPDIRRMAVAATKDNAVRSIYWDHEPTAPPFLNLKTSWEAFIDSLMREWKTLNIISVLLLSAILTILQIEAAASDPIIRYSALTSLICALMSLLYGCMFIIRFGTMRKASKAAEWAEEAQKSKTLIWWNVWVLLATPSVWLSWSIIFYLTCIMSFLWRTGTTHDPSVGLLPRAALGPRLTITLILVLGLIYFLLIINTFRRYDDTKARKERMLRWARSASVYKSQPSLVPPRASVDDISHNTLRPQPADHIKMSTPVGSTNRAPSRVRRRESTDIANYQNSVTHQRTSTQPSGTQGRSSVRTTAYRTSRPPMVTRVRSSTQAGSMYRPPSNLLPRRSTDTAVYSNLQALKRTPTPIEHTNRPFSSRRQDSAETSVRSDSLPRENTRSPFQTESPRQSSSDLRHQSGAPAITNASSPIGGTDRHPSRPQRWGSADTATHSSRPPSPRSNPAQATHKPIVRRESSNESMVRRYFPPRPPPIRRSSTPTTERLDKPLLARKRSEHTIVRSIQTPQIPLLQTMTQPKSRNTSSHMVRGGDTTNAPIAPPLSMDLESQSDSEDGERDDSIAQGTGSRGGTADVSGHGPDPSQLLLSPPITVPRTARLRVGRSEAFSPIFSTIYSHSEAGSRKSSRLESLGEDTQVEAQPNSS